MFFQRLKTPGLGHNSYVLGCGDGLAVVIDPRRDVDDYLRLARENNLSIAYVLETHRQEDFEFGSRTLAQMTGAKIVGGSHALFGETDVKLEDDEEIKVGTTRFVALATPGHTPESMCYAVYVKDAGDKCWGVFTGDTLFVGDTGHTDLSDPDKTGDNAGILYDSIHRKIAPLGEHMLLFPGHGAGSACGGNISERDDSTLGIEKGTNPAFLKSRLDFVAHKLGEKMARSAFFQHMEKVNLLPGRPLKWPSTVRVLQPGEFKQRMKEGVVIDTRSLEAFAAAHIPVAYNIWLAGLPAFGSWVANENTRIFLIAEGTEAMERASWPRAWRAVATRVCRSKPSRRPAPLKRQPGCSRVASTSSTCATNMNGTKNTSRALCIAMSAIWRTSPRCCPRIVKSSCIATWGTARAWPRAS